MFINITLPFPSYQRKGKEGRLHEFQPLSIICACQQCVAAVFCTGAMVGTGGKTGPFRVLSLADVPEGSCFGTASRDACWAIAGVRNRGTLAEG